MITPEQLRNKAMSIQQSLTSNERSAIMMRGNMGAYDFLSHGT